MRNVCHDRYDAGEGYKYSLWRISETTTDNDITRREDRNFIVNITQLLLHYADKSLPFLQYGSVSLSQRF